jgi:hypothetical protein
MYHLCWSAFRIVTININIKHALNEPNDINCTDTPVPAYPVIKLKTLHRKGYGRHKLGMLVHASSSFNDAISTVYITRNCKESIHVSEERNYKKSRTSHDMQRPSKGQMSLIRRQSTNCNCKVTPYQHFSQFRSQKCPERKKKEIKIHKEIYYKNRMAQTTRKILEQMGK